MNNQIYKLNNLAYVNQSTSNQNVIQNQNTIISNTSNASDSSNVNNTTTSTNENLILFPGVSTSKLNNTTYTDPTKEECEVFAFKSSEDIQKLALYFASVKPSSHKWRDLCIFSIGCNIGLRGGDLLSRKWGDILQNGQIRDGVIIYEEKTDKKRKFHLNQDCKDAIYLYLDNTYQDISTVDLDNYIFPSRKGGFITVRAYGKILKQAAKEVGIEYNVGTHSMRKTFGYNIYKNTNNIELVQKMFGHSNNNITLRYIGIDDEMIKDGYNGLDLNITGYANEYLNQYMSEVIES